MVTEHEDISDFDFARFTLFGASLVQNRYLLSVSISIWLIALVICNTLTKHAEKKDKDDGDEGGKWTVGRDGRKELKDSVEDPETIDDSGELDHEGKRDEGETEV